MNSVVLIGRLTRDPELRYLPSSNTAVTTFSLAVDKGLTKDRKAEAEAKGQPTADFINIVCWGKTAENVANFMSKGLMVAVSGRIQSRSYEDNSGQRKYVTEVVAREVEFLEWKDKRDNGGYKNNDSNDLSGGFDDDFQGFEPRNEDNIPF